MDVEQKIYLEQLKKKIDTIITIPRHRDVMRLRFGLVDDGRERTLEEVGQLFGVTRERIRQIENKCIAKIRCKLQTKQSDEWISV